jgi:hypothetical protein
VGRFRGFEWEEGKARTEEIGREGDERMEEHEKMVFLVEILDEINSIRNFLCISTEGSIDSTMDVLILRSFEIWRTVRYSIFSIAFSM